jgi:hypothetical protein
MGRKSKFEANFAKNWDNARRGGLIPNHIPDPVQNKSYGIVAIKPNGEEVRPQFDFGWIEPRVALEIDGLVPINTRKPVYGRRSDGTRYPRKGRHQTIEGFTEDRRKRMAARMADWFVYEVAGQDIENDPLRVIDDLVQLIEKRMKDGS